MVNRRPPDHVLASFGLDPNFPCHPLTGGQGSAWRCDQVILKPTSHAAADEWIATTTERLHPTGYRLARPLRGVSGGFVESGWCAWQMVSGEHGSGGQWPVIFTVAQLLLRDMQDLPRPSFLADRTDMWAIGDQVAWNDDPRTTVPAFNSLIDPIAGLRIAEELPSQVIHSDIYGNVLFHPSQPPAVIDLSPMWHPATYCLCIAAVDAIAWYSAPVDILDDLRGYDGALSLLARAAIFRLATAAIVAEHHATPSRYIAETVDEFTPVIAAICQY